MGAHLAPSRLGDPGQGAWAARLPGRFESRGLRRAQGAAEDAGEDLRDRDHAVERDGVPAGGVSRYPHSASAASSTAGYGVSVTRATASSLFRAGKARRPSRRHRFRFMRLMPTSG